MCETPLTITSREHSLRPFRSSGAHRPDEAAVRRSNGSDSLRRKPQQAGVCTILDHPDRAVGCHYHVADAPAQGPAVRLMGGAVRVEDYAHQALGAQAADQGRALPGGECRALVEGQSGRRDHRGPVQNGGVEFRAGGMPGNGPAAVLVPVRDLRPAVVAAAPDPVQFIAAAWSHFVFPQRAVRREGQTVGVAVARAPGQGADTGLPGHGVVRRGGAVRVHAQDLAPGGIGVLGRFRLHPVADRQEQVSPARRKGDDAAGLSALAGGLLAPQRLRVLQVCAAAGFRQPGAGQDQHAAAILGCHAGEIQQAIPFEVRRGHHVQQAVLAPVVDRRQAVDGGSGAGLGDQEHAAGLFGDDQAPVRQEGNRPGMVKGGDPLDGERRGFVRRERAGVFRCRLNGGERQGQQGGQHQSGPESGAVHRASSFMGHIGPLYPSERVAVSVRIALSRGGVKGAAPSGLYTDGIPAGADAPAFRFIVQELDP